MYQKVQNVQVQQLVLNVTRGTCIRGTYTGGLQLGDLYPGTHIRWLISGGLNPELISEGYYPGAYTPGDLYLGFMAGGLMSGGLYPGLISGVIYARAYIQ